MRALLKRPEVLSQTLHEDEYNVLDLDIAIAKRLLQCGENIVVEVGNLQRVGNGVVVRILLVNRNLRALVVADDSTGSRKRTVVAALESLGVVSKETTRQRSRLLGQPVNSVVSVRLAKRAHLLVGQGSPSSEITLGLLPSCLVEERGEREVV